MSTGLIRTFKHYVPPFTGWFYKASGNEEADRVNLYDVLFGSPNEPLSLNLGSVYASDLDTSGSSIGTFLGEITDLVDSLDTTFQDTSSTNPKYFEVKLLRPIENAGIKFCAPVGGTFSNVKIILKDRSGVTLFTCDNSADNTDLESAEYDWPLLTWCTARVEFHTADPIKINWMFVEKSLSVHVHSKYVDRANQTSTPLGAGQTWTGEWVGTNDFVQAIIDITTDQSGTLTIELSSDGSTVDHSHSFSILSNTPNGHHYPSELELAYYRPKYTNGATPQGSFSLHSTLFTVMVEEGHSHSINYALKDDHPAPIIRSVLTAKKPNGDYTNIQATAGGNLKISMEELETAVEQSLSLRPLGAGTNSSVTLTNANTAYAVPSAAPASSYDITLYNGSDTSIFLGYQNTNANGIELPPGDTASDRLGNGQQLYAYCASSGKAITFTTKLVI